MNMILNRGESQIKNVPKMEKVQKGGEGSATDIKKSTIQNVDFFIRGEEAIFSFFSQM